MITPWKPPKKPKQITRYYLLSQTYLSAKKNNSGDGTIREVRALLNEYIDYSVWKGYELTGDKLKLVRLFNPGGGRPKGVKNK